MESGAQALEEIRSAFHTLKKHYADDTLGYQKAWRTAIEHEVADVLESKEMSKEITEKILARLFRVE